MSNDYGEQTPAVLSQQTMLYLTMGQNVTIDVGNQVAKKQKSEINALP